MSPSRWVQVGEVAGPNPEILNSGFKLFKIDDGIFSSLASRASCSKTMRSLVTEKIVWVRVSSSRISSILISNHIVQVRGGF